MASRLALIPRLVVAGTASGVGKTTVTVALARAFRDRGLTVATFKCGPDYLDPTYHSRATDSECHTLDAWMMTNEQVLSTFAEETRGADIALIEGMMGLFDGVAPTSNSGSTAQIARWLHAPILLVIDAGGMARSVAALVHGFASFEPELDVAGVIANRVGSAGHLELVRQAVESVPVWGGLPTDRENAFVERHLGLTAADRNTVDESVLDFWGNAARDWIDLDEVWHAARSSPSDLLHPSLAQREPAAPPRCRIGIAKDAAFHFYYVDNLRRLADSGAELVPFSPLTAPELPDVDGFYLGGGYPEAHAGALEANAPFRRALRDFADRGGPIYAECGGLMYLTQSIRPLGGSRRAMVGVVNAEAIVSERLRAIGYVQATTLRDTILGPAGTRLRGHQFRHSELSVAAGDTLPAAFSLKSPQGVALPDEGFASRNVVASYVHAHFASSPGIAANFVAACTKFRRERHGRSSSSVPAPKRADR
jgi:cobyrinic acid a,c-diamide synthase